MPKTAHSGASDAVRMASSPGPSRRRYHRDALGAVLSILGAISAEAAVLFAAIVAVRGDRHGSEERELDRAELGAMLMLVNDDELDRYLLDVSDQITDTIAMNVLDSGCRTSMVGNIVKAASGGRPLSALERLMKPPQAESDGKDPVPVLLGHDFVALLDDPLSPAPSSFPTPRLDRIGREDIAMVEAVLRSGVSGHLAVRRRAHAPREIGDLAAILGADEQPVLLYEGLGKGCMAAILRAELHAGACPPIVLVERDLLTTRQRCAEDSLDEVDGSAPDEASVTTFAQNWPLRLLGTRGVYLWSIPEDHLLSTASLPWIGACIGPLRLDPAWVRDAIADHLGIVDDTGRSPAITALARRSKDPRDAGAMATMARSIAAMRDDDLDRACSSVAASFARDCALVPEAETHFDPRLLVCTDEAHQLLARAREAAANGVRLVAHGPPGSGKSAYIRELARRMAGGSPVRFIGPADFLAKFWGATEKLVRDLWRSAADDGSILAIDEFDVVGGRRLEGDVSNNTMLIRSLTNAWLNAMDEFPAVPMLASTNDRAALDLAIVRRAAFVLRFGDELSTTQERLAWRILLGREPPLGWKPVGAAVADFVLARQRCKMLGQYGGKSLEDAVKEAASARRPIETNSVKARVGSLGTRH